MAERIYMGVENALRVIAPAHPVSANLYVVVLGADLAYPERKPTTVFPLNEWRAKPEGVRRAYRTALYRATDPLDAYVQALKEQTDD